MSVTFELRQNARIIYSVLSDPWTIDDLLDVIAKSRTYFDQRAHQIHVLVNASRTQRIPMGSLLRLRDHLLVNHPNYGEIVLVAASPIIYGFANAMFSLCRYNRVKFFRTEQDAWRYLCGLLAAEQASYIVETT